MAIEKGIHQGCVMSPDLFNIYNEQIFKQIKDIGGIKWEGKL